MQSCGVIRRHLDVWQGFLFEIPFCHWLPGKEKLARCLSYSRSSHLSDTVSRAAVVRRKKVLADVEKSNTCLS